MKIKTWWTALLGAALAAGCGGGSDSAVNQTPAGYQVSSAVVQKGPLAHGSWVSINELNDTTLLPAGTSFNFEVIDDYGTFKPAGMVFAKPLLESTAQGYYFDEITGQVSTSMVALRALTDLSADRAINVNLLTDLSNARIRALVTRASDPLKFSTARHTAQREVLRPFLIYNSADLLPGGEEPASFGELDLSKNRSADRMLAAISAVVTQIGRTGSGINQFINQFEADLADDGELNNSPGFALAPGAQINSAIKLMDWDKVALNLNTLYKTDRYKGADLKQWVDSSGGVDQVIDRYKFGQNDVPVGTKAKSPEYVVGEDDTDQCFSASAGQLYRNGVAVSGTVKAAKGDKFQIELTGANLTEGGFIQRSAPASGVCPTTVATVGLTRLAKWTLNDGIKMVAAGQNIFALKKDGGLWAWGKYNSDGQLGDGTYSTSLTPKQIGTGYSAVSARGSHTVALKIDGSLWAWGSNYAGQLGDGTTISSKVPKQIGTGYRAISTGYGYTLAIKTDGSLWAWGSNSWGQLGDGTYNTSLTPKQIGTDYSAVNARDSHAAALKSDGSLWTWGMNGQGELGDGSSANSLVPKQIGTGYSAVAPDEGYTVAIKSDGSLWTWGSNYTGELGDGTNNPSLVPKQIGTGYSSVAAGSHRALALKTNGSLWAWGYNVTGQLGDGTYNDSLVPKQIGTGYRAVDAGNYRTIAIKTDGSLWAWGDGPLGDGTMNSSLVPKQVMLP